MSPQPAPTSDGVAPIRRKSRYYLWIAVVGVLAAMAGLYRWNSRMPAIQAVEVRKFAVTSGPPWLAGAITEDIVDVLRPVTQPTAAPAATAVLEGNIAKAGDRVHITSTLSRPDGHRYWTRTFDAPLTAIAVEVAAAIAAPVRKRNSRRKTAPAVYERYLEGRQLFAHSDFAAAAEAFDAAAQSDPAFALAFAWLAIAKESLAEQGAGRPNELLPGARDAAERAVILAPDVADTHLALGIIRLQYDWDWDAARRELARALELSPRHPLAQEWQQRWLEAMNRAPAPALHLPNVPRDPEGARLLLAQADDLRARGYVTPLAFALAANVTHDADSLFRWLDVAYEERSVQLPYLLRDPALPQADPRLADLIRRLKLPINQ
jgi:tetratricopeptide (TPR) repeat protein